MKTFLAVFCNNLHKGGNIDTLSLYDRNFIFGIFNPSKEETKNFQTFYYVDNTPTRVDILNFTSRTDYYVAEVAQFFNVDEETIQNQVDSLYKNLRSSQ